MKLTKGKISKLYGKQKQSRRKNKKRKTSNKNRTFRRKRNLNLMRKSLKRYRGGVDTNQVVGQSLEGTTQEENPVTNLTQGEDLGFPPNQVTSNEDLSPPPPIDESLDPKKVEDLSPPPPPIDESLSPVVKDEDLSYPPPPIDFTEWDGLVRLCFMRKNKTLGAIFRIKHVVAMLYENYKVFKNSTLPETKLNPEIEPDLSAML